MIHSSILFLPLPAVTLSVEEMSIRLKLETAFIAKLDALEHQMQMSTLVSPVDIRGLLKYVFIQFCHLVI